MHGDRTGVRILGVRRAGDDDLHVRARGGDARSGLTKDRPVPLHLLRATPRKQAERLPLRVEAQHAARVDPRGRGGPVLEWMPHERRDDPALAEKLFLERQDDRELIHRGELAHPLGPPRPHLRRDVVQHGNTGGRGGSGGTEVITRVIDEDHEIVALVLERLLDPVQQAVVRGNLGDGLDKPDDRVRFHPVQHAHARALERRAAQGFQLEPWKTAAQCGRYRRGMRVRGRLPCRDVDPRHGRAAASGEALMASATR